MLSGLLKGLKDLIYPNCCLICKNKIEPSKLDPDCSSCWEKLEKNLPPYCACCGRHLDAKAIEKNICSHCLGEKFYFDRAFSPCEYKGNIKKLIHEFKYTQKDYLGKTLGSLMNAFIKDYSLPIEYLDFIIPVPLHRSRLREREFNQAAILSHEIGKEFHKPILTNVLIRNKATKRQADLIFLQRRKNVENSFSVVKPDLIKDKNLLLIDDVLTTAATSNQAAKSLKNAGAKMVLLLTLAN